MEEGLGIEQLKLLKKVFEDADDDGSGELDIDEFCEQLGPYLGSDLTHTEITQLFMKIDADAGGTVDWDEFSNYMFLQRSDADEDSVDNWKFFPMTLVDRNEPSASHHKACTSIHFIPQIDKYITTGKDSTFRVWNCQDLKQLRIVNNGSEWINDLAYLEEQRKVVLVSMDRSISYYDINRGAYDLTGRIYASGSMGVPTCVTTAAVNGRECVLYGDTKGTIVLLLCESNELPARDLLHTAYHQDYMNLHTEHTDWVTKVQDVAHVGLVTSSMDSRILITDISREKIIQCATHHKKGVMDFAWCKAYSLFASCSERTIVLWQGNTARKISELPGHAAPIMSLAIDEVNQQLVSMSTDKALKIWDLRTNKCLQTIGEEDWVKQEDASPSCMVYDGVHRRLVTGTRRPYIWDHKLILQDKTGHREPLVKGIFNSSFEVVCTVDESGAIVVWNLETGDREGRFFNAHGTSKVTTCCFDSNERRLVTAANDGQVKIWNFNNGSLLREYAHSDEAMEISKVIYLTDEKRKSDCVYAAGWNAKVYIWEDEDEDVVEEYKTLEGHKDDILAMDAFLDHALLATGDYEGRINVWNINSGERRMSMFHKADRFENSVEALQWLPISSDVPEGRHIAPMLLLSSGADSIIRVWHVGAVGSLLCTLQGATGHLESVSDLCCDASYQHVVMSDTSGHIKVWHTDAMDVSTPEATYDSFRLRSYFRVSEASVNGVQCILDRGMVICASADTNAYLFNLDGGLIGVFGIHSWDIHDDSTFQDITGSAAMKPLDDSLVLLENARMRKEVVENELEDEAEPLPWDGIRPAVHALKERRERVQANLTKLPMDAVHGNLRVHPVQEVPAQISDLFSRTSRSKKPAAKRNKKISGVASAK